MDQVGGYILRLLSLRIQRGAAVVHNFVHVVLNLAIGAEASTHRSHKELNHLGSSSVETEREHASRCRQLLIDRRHLLVGSLLRHLVDAAVIVD